MIDTLTLDQIRVFVAVVDQGSFSGAARHLNRAQSAISYAIANLEELLAIQLFDRSTRIPHVTQDGQLLLKEARHVLEQVQHFRERAAFLTGEVEPELVIGVDVLFPIEILTSVCQSFAEVYPEVNIRIFTEALGAVIQRFHEGLLALAVTSPVALNRPGIQVRSLFEIPMLPVVACTHPLASYAEVSRSIVQEYIQVVITDRSSITENIEHGVMSQRPWRVTDVWTKHAFLLNGLGWGNMPYPFVKDDLAEGRLVRLTFEENSQSAFAIPMFFVTHHSRPLGPAGRWFKKALYEAVHDYERAEQVCLE